MFIELFVLFVGLLAYLIYALFLERGSAPSYWKQHGIPEVDPSVVASNLDILLGRKNITERDDYAYKVLGSKPFCGIVERPSPVILVKDLELIKKIMIKDFDHFVDRRDFFPLPKHSILTKAVFFARGDEWKGIRSTMSPAFTTGKIRRLMEIFNSVGKDWVGMLKSKANADPSGSATIVVTNTVNQFTLDVIASAVFGIDAGTIKNPDTTFALKARHFTDPTFIQIVKFILGPRYPKLFKMLGTDVFNPAAIKFFESLFRQGFESRVEKGEKRNDFLQILVEAQKGQINAVGADELDEFEKEAEISHNKKVKFTDDIVVAQSMVFFIAGFSGITQLVTLLSYVLAVHQDAQEKLRSEVKEIVKKDGSIDYDDVGKLGYLEMITCEVLRMYGGSLRLERDCNLDYHDKESGLFIKKGTTVIIPVHAIHNDPTFYENPEKFDPLRWSYEEKSKRSPYTYLPFGVGPRNCVGMRFALTESKTLIAHLIHNFKIEPAASTPVPIKMRLVGQSFIPPDKLELKLTPLHM